MNKITVITVVFNGGQLLEKTIQSVLSLQYNNIEYIIIDGGSSDSTLEIIDRYKDKIDNWISEPDNGIYDAMNKGIRMATGHWINFMNAGDSFCTPFVLNDFREEKFPAADIVFGDAIIEFEDYKRKFNNYPLTSMWKNSPFCHQACFSKATLLKEYMFDTSYNIGADHEFFFRAYKMGKKFTYWPQLICYFDGRQGATKKRIIEAISDKKRAAMRYDYSLGKLIYFNLFLIYIRFNSELKKLIGPSLTRKFTKWIKG